MRDDSMSLYEFVGRLYMHLKDFEGTLDEAHEKIDDFITRFDTKLDKTTAQILTEWKNDGTLAELINLVWAGKAEQILTEWKNDGTLAELINLVWEDKADKTYVDSLSQEVSAHKEDYATYIDSELDFVLRDLPNGTKDEIRVSGGKAEHIQRVSDEIILDGNLAWSINETSTNTYRGFLVNWASTNNALQAQSGFLENNADLPYLISTIVGNDARLIAIHSTDALYVRIEKSKIDAMIGSTITDRFKAYLNLYPITLNYQLAEPIIAELPLDDLSSNTQQIVKLSSKVEKLTNAIIALGGTIV